MTFEYILEPENKKKTLSKGQTDEVAQNIVSNFKTYNDGRASNLDRTEKLIDEIFFSDNFKKRQKNKTKDWKADVKMRKTYMFYQVLKSFIWKNVYSNINSMFDVSGENQNADNDSNKQKAALVDIFEKMEYQKTADTIIDNALLYGELISFVGWKKKTEEIRRPISFFESLFQEDINKLPMILKAAAAGRNYWIDERPVYDNPCIYAVNPSDLAFDVSQMDDWDNCPKILKSFKVPEDIINNKLYQIDKQTAKDIKAMVEKPTEQEQSQQGDNDLQDEVVNGGTIEVLEHWGSIKLPDGTLLKNWHAVVVGRKYLIRFCKNTLVINPFTFGTIVKDRKTKRGISPVFCVLELALTQEELLNRTYNMQSLNENPPIHAPKNYFKDKEIELFPGKIIEYEEDLSPGQIKPMEFNSSIFLGDVGFINDLMSEVSGIFPNMAGADEVKAKTATEINTKSQGQMTRLSMILDTINQYLVVPDVKGVATLCANFKYGLEEIFINKDNQKEVIQIDDQVRQGDYKYTYSDRSATEDRYNKADMVVQACEKFAQFIPLNAQELFIWYMEQKGVENPERFLASMPIMPNMSAAMPQQMPQPV